MSGKNNPSVSDSEKRILTETFSRDFALDRASADEEKRTVELSFSSEEPYERWFGIEILDHSQGSVDMSRLKTGAAVLVNHDTDQHVGVVESARVDADKRGRAVVRFGRSSEAEGIFRDIQDGIRSLVSVGYRVLDYKRIKAETDEDGNPKGPDTYRVIRWQPMEISIVSVPADATVGVGRSEELNNKQEIHFMDPEKDKTQPVPEVNLAEIKRKATEEARQVETVRQNEIRNFAERVKDRLPKIGEMAKHAIDTGMDAREFKQRTIEEIQLAPVQPIAAPRASDVGMSEKESNHWSFRKALLEASQGKLSGLEKEASDAFAKKHGKEARSFWIPTDVLGSPFVRTHIAATATLGGNLRATELLANDFISLLRNRMIVTRMGAQVWSGLQGNIAIPRQYGAGTVYWSASELASTTESNMTFDQVTMTPNIVTALQKSSRQLLLQASLDVENQIRNDLVTIIALAEDKACLEGTGTEQPTGILNTSGIGTVTIGAAGGAPTWATIVGLETEVATDNADVGNLGYLGNAAVRGKLKQTDRSTVNSNFIWTDATAPIMPGEGIVNGYRFGVTNQFNTNITKSSNTALTSIVFGNWNDLIIGQWGGIDILVDPYSGAATQEILYYASLYTDVAVRHPESFASCEDVLTT